MEWFGNIIAVTKHDLTRSDDGEGVMSADCYKKLVARGQLTMLRPGKGLGSYALIEYASMPSRFRDRFEAKYGDPEKTMRQMRLHWQPIRRRSGSFTITCCLTESICPRRSRTNIR